MWYMVYQQLADWDAKLRPDSLMLSSALNACRDGAELGGNCAEQARFWSARRSKSDIYIYMYYIYIYILFIILHWLHWCHGTVTEATSIHVLDLVLIVLLLSKFLVDSIDRYR